MPSILPLGTLFAIWRIRQFFSQPEHRHRSRLDPSPPLVCFHSLFNEPPPPSSSQRTLIKKGSLEEMEGVDDNASALMHLNITINK